MASVSQSDFGVNVPTPNSNYYRPTAIIAEGREVVFASTQSVVMGTHPKIPNVVIIGNLGIDLPEDYVAGALSHEEIHNTLNKLGEDEREISVSFLDRIGRAVTELDDNGLALEGIMEENFRQFKTRKVLYRARGIFH
jgi:hypothetical protein